MQTREEINKMKAIIKRQEAKESLDEDFINDFFFDRDNRQEIRQKYIEKRREISP